MDYETVSAYWAKRKAQMIDLRSRKWTFPQIAAKFKVTPQRAQQIVNGKRSRRAK